MSDYVTIFFLLTQFFVIVFLGVKMIKNVFYDGFNRRKKTKNKR
tara:strand:- start:2749 stop:2880 length:132 start_codon:yes stop_codon:yes gene_type:complete